MLLHNLFFIQNSGISISKKTLILLFCSIPYNYRQRINSRGNAKIISQSPSFLISRNIIISLLCIFVSTKKTTLLLKLVVLLRFNLLISALAARII